MRWKKLFQITKPGKENTEDVTKFSSISLINKCGKVLEKLLIDRINHHVFSHNNKNKNQYRLMPQKSTIDVAVAVKNIVSDGLTAGDVIVLVSLDVKGDFDAAILNRLRAYECPNNLFNLVRSYFTQRSDYQQLPDPERGTQRVPPRLVLRSGSLEHTV